MISLFVYFYICKVFTFLIVSGVKCVVFAAALVIVFSASLFPAKIPAGPGLRPD